MAPVVQVHGEASEVHLCPWRVIRVRPIVRLLCLAIRRRAACLMSLALWRSSCIPLTFLCPFSRGGILFFRLLPSPPPPSAAPNTPEVLGPLPCRVIAAWGARPAPSGCRGGVSRPHVVMRPLRGPRELLLPPTIRGCASPPRGGGVLLALTTRVLIIVTRVEELCSVPNAL